MNKKTVSIILGLLLILPKEAVALRPSAAVCPNLSPKARIEASAKRSVIIALIASLFAGNACRTIQEKSLPQGVSRPLADAAATTPATVERKTPCILNDWLAEYRGLIGPSKELADFTDFKAVAEHFKRAINTAQDLNQKKELEIAAAGFLYDLILVNVAYVEIVHPDDGLDSIIRRGAADCLRYCRLFEHFATEFGLKAGVVLGDRDESGLWINHAYNILETSQGKYLFIDLGSRFIAKPQRVAVIVDGDLQWVSSEELEGLAASQHKIAWPDSEGLRLLNKVGALTGEAYSLAKSGKSTESARKFAEAEEAIQRARSLTPQLEPYILNQLGNIRLYQENFDEALKDLTESGRLGLKDRPHLKYGLANIYLSRPHPAFETELADLDQAIGLLKDIADTPILPDFRVRIHHSLGSSNFIKARLLKRKGYVPEAEHALEAARSEFKKAAELSGHFARAYTYIERYNIDEDSGEEANLETGEDHDITLFLGAGLRALNNKEFADAIYYLEMAVESEPGYTQARYCLGLAYHIAAKTASARKGSPDLSLYRKAADNYTTALELGHPFSSESYFFLGQTYSYFNPYWAVKFLKLAAKRDPSNPQFYYLLSQNYFVLKRNEEAIKCLEQAKRLGLDAKGAARIPSPEKRTLGIKSEYVIISTVSTAA